jgi:hypothetical protein
MVQFSIRAVHAGYASGHRGVVPCHLLRRVPVLNPGSEAQNVGRALTCILSNLCRSYPLSPARAGYAANALGSCQSA